MRAHSSAELELGEPLERRLEGSDGGGVLASRDAHAPERPVAARLQQRRAGPLAQLGEALRPRAGLGEVTLLDLGRDEQFDEPRRADGLLAQHAQAPAQECGSRAGLAAGEPDRRERIRGDGVLLEAVEQPRRGVDPALRQPQLRELRHGMGVDRGLRGAGRLDGPRELRLGLLPAAEAHEHRAVVGPAQDVQVGRADAAVEAVRRADPLRGALELRDEGADGDRLAARVDGGLRAALAAERAGHGLVEQRDALGDVAERDPVGAELAHRAQLQVDVAVLPRGGERLPREHLGAPRIAGLAGHRRPAERDPAAQRREALVLDEPRGPVHPALRRRDVPEARPVARDEPERDERGLHRLAAAAVRRVRALAQLERPVGVLQPPQRRAETRERLGGLPLGQRGLEAVASPRPLACREGLARRGQRSVGRHGPTLRPAGDPATI